MNNLKKVLALVMAMLMLASFATIAFAENMKWVNDFGYENEYNYAGELKLGSNSIAADMNIYSFKAPKSGYYVVGNWYCDGLCLNSSDSGIIPEYITVQKGCTEKDYEYTKVCCLEENQVIYLLVYGEATMELKFLGTDFTISAYKSNIVFSDYVCNNEEDSDFYEFFEINFSDGEKYYAYIDVYVDEEIAAGVQTVNGKILGKEVQLEIDVRDIDDYIDKIVAKETSGSYGMTGDCYAYLDAVTVCFKDGSKKDITFDYDTLFNLEVAGEPVSVDVDDWYTEVDGNKADFCVYAAGKYYYLSETVEFEKTSISNEFTWMMYKIKSLVKDIFSLISQFVKFVFSDGPEF